MNFDVCLCKPKRERLCKLMLMIFDMITDSGPVCPQQARCALSGANPLLRRAIPRARTTTLQYPLQSSRRLLQPVPLHLFYFTFLSTNELFTCAYGLSNNPHGLCFYYGHLTTQCGNLRLNSSVDCETMG